MSDLFYKRPFRSDFRAIGVMATHNTGVIATHNTGVIATHVSWVINCNTGIICGYKTGIMFGYIKSHSKIGVGRFLIKLITRKFGIFLRM